MLGTPGTPRTLRKTHITGFDWSDRVRSTCSPATPPIMLTPTSSQPEIEIDSARTRYTQGWSLADERACTARCRYCRQPIVWGEVQGYEPNGTRTDWTRVATDRRWMPLDPDMFPHGCDSSRSGSVEAAPEGRSR